MLDYIIWNVSPEIIEGFRVRWYGLLFAIGFFVSYTFLGKIFKKEGLQQKELDSFTFMTFILLIVGLRLGHCLFYEPAEYLKNPIKILFVWEGGLASHGGAIGLLLSFFIFSRKSGKNFIWIASRAAIVIPFTAACVRLGNLMNSEIYGVSTDLSWGFAFIRDSNVITTPEILSNILIQSNIVAQNLHEQLVSFLSLHAAVFKQGIPYIELKNALIQSGFMKQDQSNTLVQALIQNKLISVNHPTQIYEALVYIITFGILMSYYFIRKAKDLVVSSYLILAITLIIIFLSRFIIEFIKNDQVGFERGMSINMGQWLSLPFIILGVFCLYKFFKEKQINQFL